MNLVLWDYCLISLSLLPLKYGTLYTGILQPLFMWSMTCCFSWKTCSFNALMTLPSSVFSPFRFFTLSSSFEMRSSLRLRHLDAATRFRCRFRSNLIFSWVSISMGLMGGELGTVCGSSFIATGKGSSEIDKENNYVSFVCYDGWIK